MGIFSRKPPSSDAQKAEEILAKIQRERKPIFALATAIASAAMKGGQALKSKINADSEDKINEQFIYVCYEFLYFFLHLTDRMAYQKLGAERRSKLMDALEPLIVSPAVDAFFDHWPEEYKVRMRSEFRQKFNDAQRGYGECKGMVSDTSPVTGNSLLSTFARNVAELCGNSPTNPLVHVIPYGIAVESYKQLDLANHIDAVGKVL
jgi:hypothetical protein